MITTLRHGVFAHDNAAGAIVQSLEVDAQEEESTLLGMVGEKTQVVRTWTHTEKNVFSVNGSGDLTLSTGTNADPKLGLLSGGVANILSFKYTQELANPSKWTYSGNHYPYAAAA